MRVVWAVGVATIFFWPLEQVADCNVAMFDVLDGALPVVEASHCMNWSTSI